ncbi:uncharacterized protein V6R79_006386 [Siganus canaliculatus]
MAHSSTAVSGLQAVPLAVPSRAQKTSSIYQIPDGFQQGTEPRRFLVDLDSGLVKERVSEMDRRADFTHTSLGNRELGSRPWLTDDVPMVGPVQKNGGGGWMRVEEYLTPHLPDGFRQGTEPSRHIPDGFQQGTEPSRHIPDGFRQGTEPSRHIPEGFRQGTEPSRHIPDGFQQGTEPSRHIPDGFRQGTEPSRHIPDGFRQGTEPSRHIPDGFRQGTEPSRHIPDGFRQGTEPSRHIPDGFRQGTEPSSRIPEGFRQGTEPLMPMPAGFRQGTEPIRTMPTGIKPMASSFQTNTVACKGKVISGNCFEFNPTELPFHDAQALCRALAPNAELASVTNGDVHSRLASLVTRGGRSDPVLTWLGGTVKNQQASWVDGSEWHYSDWMPGHPNIHTDKPVCVEMFKMNQSWWTAADCELKRASICSYTLTA